MKKKTLRNRILVEHNTPRVHYMSIHVQSTYGGPYIKWAGSNASEARPNVSASVMHKHTRAQTHSGEHALTHTYMEKKV